MFKDFFTKHTLNYRPDIDGMRAIAIILVVVYHAFPTVFKKGFIGVDIFFVISGYLISQIIMRELEAGKFSFMHFYARRARRILPAFLTVLISTLFLGLIILTPNEFANLCKHAIASLFFVENFLLLKEVGYFDIASDSKPLLHIWSLSLEEQFYFITPLLFFILYKLRIKYIYTIITIIVLSLSLNIYFVNGSKQLFDEGLNEAFYMIYSRAWELSFGSLAAYLSVYYPKATLKNRLFIEILAFISILLLTMSATGIIRDKIQGIYAVIPIFILILYTKNSFINKYILSNKILVFIGLVSYPLYLWHWSLLSLIKINEGFVPHYALSAVVVLSFILSILTYIFIEKPAQNYQNQRKSILIGLMSMALFLAILTPNASSKTDSSVQIHAGCTNKGEILPLYDWCYSQHKTINSIALIGDSHADHLFYGLVKHNNSDKKIRLLAEGWCSFYLDKGLTKSKRTDCSSEFIRATHILLKNDQTVETIVFSSISQFNSVGQLSKEQSILHHVGLLQNTIDFYKDTSKKLIFILDTPSMSIDVRTCGIRKATFIKLFKEMPECGVKLQDIVNSREIYYRTFEALKKNNPQINVHNPLHSVCFDGFCPVFKNSESLYRDDHHLSNLGSELVALDFLKMLHQISSLSAP